MSWLPVVEKAIKEGDLQLANNTLLELSPEERPLLPTHHIDELPILHYIARKRFDTANQPELDKLIQFYISNGYDINIKTDKYKRITFRRAAFGFTALLASVEESNHILLLSLIKNGADINVRDNHKRSACHWAVYVGNFNIFKTLMENGAQVTTSESEKLGIKDVHPILHTAVDEGNSEIVFYLLNNNLVDVNEGVADPIFNWEESMARVLSKYNAAIMFQAQDDLYSPLARAVGKRNLQMIKLLLKFKPKQSGFSELHFCISKGDTEVACMLLDKTNDELANDKIGDKWALHCLHPISFKDELRLDFTKKLILTYINSGWDVNSTTLVPSKMEVEDVLDTQYNLGGRILITMSIFISNFTLLHIACLYGCKELVQWLIKEGADLNVITGEEGHLQMSLLQLCIFQRKWDNAKMLVQNGADPSAKGRIEFIKKSGKVASVQTSKISLYGRTPWFNGVELLLKIGNISQETGLVFDEMVKKGIPWIGVKELQMAIIHGNPNMICKVLRSVQDKVNLKDLVYVNDSYIINVYSIFYLMSNFKFFGDEEKLIDFANLLEKFADFGYNYNTCHGRNFGYSDPLIFYLIKRQFNVLSDVLLSRMLLIPHVCLAVRNEAGQTPVEYVLSLWDSRCIQEGLKCWECGTEESYWCKIVEILIHHGADMSNVTIGNSIKYHHGYEKMMKMLVTAGAKLSPEFFTSPICHVGHIRTLDFSKELDKLKEWMREKEKDKMSLKAMAKSKVRSMLSSIDHLKILNGLPEILRDEVLCKIY